ncbi:MAG: amino acid adenylation domain-containing protein, partial [Rhizobacter sp.]
MTARRPSPAESPAAPRALASVLRDAARRWPLATALETPLVSLSYDALLQHVQSMSARLVASGFRPGDRIGIAATRSADTIVAILAVVDAGLAYVPLDLAYPADRLQAMLEDARPRAVLGDDAALAELGRLAGAFPTLAHPAPAGDAPHGAAPDLTYVLFTSGSTGRPKGVAMGAAPLAHLTDWHAAHERLGRAARTLLFAPLSFDVHFQEIFSTLACGGTLVMVPEAVRRDPAALHHALVAQRIERIFLPYVALQMIAQAAGDDLPSHLTDVISAGEQLQVTPAIRRLFERLPHAALHNHYGPTESHVVTAFELTGAASAWPEIPAIGRALPHTVLALCDPETGRPTEGDTGELLIGGATLAHGYLGREDLTGERFRTDIPELPGRWYRSGDLVRTDAHGVLTYLGRADQQLKVDGFRIEPGEIELVLMAHPAVRDAVVTAPDIPGAGRQLVAHLVLDAGQDVQALTPALRSHLRARLPEYMVPVR